MSDAPGAAKKKELADLEVPEPLDTPVEPATAGPSKATDGAEKVFDKDELTLFKQLMEKVQSAGELDKELDSDLSQFTERVENVVDSIDRIEKMEKVQLEKKLVFKESVPAPKEGAPPSEEHGPPMVETTPLETGAGTTPSMEEVASQEPQIDLPPSIPYTEVRAGRHITAEERDLSTTYSANMDKVLSKLLKLIEIKLNDGEMEEARGLTNMAVKIGGSTKFFRENYGRVLGSLNIDPSQLPIVRSAQTNAPLQSVSAPMEMRVLDPDLVGEIGLLQRKSQTALNQLKSMIETSSLPDNEIERIRAQYLEALELYDQKMFHKSHQIALSALGTIKGRVQENIDTQLQNELYSTRGSLEELLRSDEGVDVVAMEELKDHLDRAMKFYLTNDYERANLLVKKVQNGIRDLTEPEGGKLKDMISALRKDLLRIKEGATNNQEVEELSEVLQATEDLLKKRDYSNAGKLMEQLSSSMDELRRRNELYTNARELEIKLTNRIGRLQRMGHDMTGPGKKLEYLRNYLNEGRFEDVIIIGGEIDVDLNSQEHMKRELEAKDIFNELDGLMTYVDEMEAAESLKAEFSTIRTKYIEGDHGAVKILGSPLLQLLRDKTKTLDVERNRRIASTVIESKILSTKLRNMKMDATDYDRLVRKAKNMIREGEPLEGLKQMDRLNAETRESLRKHLDYIRSYVSIYRDSLEVILDRHKDEPVIYFLRNRQVPLLRRMENLGRYSSAIDGYLKLESKLQKMTLPEDRKEQIESALTECKFELYRRKEKGMDISEPLSLYTLAQRKFSEGGSVVAEYLTEVTRRYYEAFLPQPA